MKWHCGCCGEAEISDTELWCKKCIRHVGRKGHLWERPYEALHNVPCPFQSKREE